MKIVFPCENCSGVVFCSPTCRDEARFHIIECKVLEWLHSRISTNKNTWLLVFRLLTQIPPQFFENTLKNLKELSPQNIFHDGRLSVFGLNLIFNLHCRPKFVRPLHIFDIYRALEKSGHFSDALKSMDKSLIFFVISKLFLVCNSNLKNEVYNSIQTTSIHAIFSLFNHSCSPPIRTISLTNCKSGYSIKPIKKFEEITISYVPTYSVRSKNERQKKLRNVYKLDCKCKVCKVLLI